MTFPADQNQDNVYEVTLRASAGGETVDFPLRVTVLNDKEGIKVTRIAEGIPEPTSFTNVINQPTSVDRLKGRPGLHSRHSKQHAGRRHFHQGQPIAR